MIADKNIRQQNATSEDRMVVQMAAILNHYPADQKYDYNTFDLMVENREQIKNIAAASQIRPEYTDPKMALICESEIGPHSKNNMGMQCGLLVQCLVLCTSNCMRL